MKKFLVAVACLFALLIVIGINGHAKVEKQAHALGMTVRQYDEWRTKLHSYAAAQDAKGMADLMTPIVKDLCKSLPIGHPSRPHKDLCALR